MATQSLQRSYRTPKGTELPLLNLRGREYLEVKYRLVWFREEHPDWAIETELLSVTDETAYARAVIKDEQGRIIATSHKFETKKGFPDFIEKAETGAIGRALALIGFGTQFCADELDEGERIVDSPVERPTARFSGEESFPPSLIGEEERPPETERERASASAARPPQDPGDYKISFGKKYKGLRLKDIPRSELEGYVEWLDDNASRKGLPLSEEARFLKVAVQRYLQATASGGKGATGKPAESSAPVAESSH